MRGGGNRIATGRGIPLGTSQPPLLSISRGTYAGEVNALNGFITLHRKMLEWEWIDDPKTAHLFVVLLLLANHAPKKWHNTQVDRGQVITGRKSLSEKTGLSEQEIRTCLKKLTKSGELTSNPTNRFSLITINNYCKYQDYNQAEQPATQPTSNQQATSKQPRLNNDNKVNKKNKDNGAKRFAPPSQEELVTFFKENKSDHVQADMFYNHFESNGWKVGGKAPMKNWQAAARNWITRNNNNPVPQHQGWGKQPAKVDYI